MRTIVVVLLTCLLSLPVCASELVGATVPPYPDGMTSEMGSCIPVGEEWCAYSIASLNDRDGAVVAVIAKRFVRRVDGRAVWEIVDARDVPVPAENQIWAFEECHVDGLADPSAIGLVAYQDKGGWIEADGTVWAVRLDTGSGKLLMLEPDTVRCMPPGS